MQERAFGICGLNFNMIWSILNPVLIQKMSANKAAYFDRRKIFNG